MLKWGEKKFPLQPGKIYMVGRKIADIVLDDSVDIKHATIEMVDGAGVLIDLYSDSGTFVDGCKLDAMVRTTIERDSTVHFGKAVTKFLLYNEHEKTFDDDSKNLSDIVFLTPKEISCKPMPNSGFSQKFLNKNDTENDQSKICDSFFIPETQYAYRKSVSLVEDISIEDSVSSFDKELSIMQEGEDFSIPGTQQPIPQSNVVESTETVESDDDGSLAHSQFRICTQEFNGFNESSDLGEEFDNLMDASQLITYKRFSLRLSHFPLQWKCIEIIMIPKPNKPENLATSNSPISLLVLFSKIFERILLRRLSPVLETRNIIPEHQFGIRQNHGTPEQLHRIVNVISDALENKRYCSAVFLDIQQAFDKVWQQGLPYKIKKLLPALYFLFFKSYLTNIQFNIKVKDEKSELREIKAGIPQGSVLGPVLHTIYTLDMPVVPNVTVATAVIAASESPVEASLLIQKEINEELELS